MRWLILSENEEKAGALRRALPDHVSVATKGLAWEAEYAGISSSPTRLPFTKIVKNRSMEELLLRLEDSALDCDRILLAFDPNTLGEACAWEYGTHLGMERCARWAAPTLHPPQVREAISQFETSAPQEMPKPYEGRANNYWVQRIIDNAWSQKISGWLTELGRTQPAVTRPMASLLKIVGEETERRALYSPKPYWEVRCSVLPQSGIGADAKPKTAYAIVPSLQMLDSSVSQTRKVWQAKTRAAREDALKGGTPQPEIGQPWRFERATAIAHTAHLKRNPFFGITKIDSTLPKGPEQGPLTYSDILDRAAKTKRQASPEAIEAHLLELYHDGWITHPHSSNPNLSPTTVDNLIRYARAQNLAVCPTQRKFGEPPEKDRWVEAICPTQWSHTPEKVKHLLPGETDKVWLYRTIYQFALHSQLELQDPPKSRVYLVGPLSLKKTGQGTGVLKEQRLTAHMSLILGLDWPGTPPDPEVAFECKSQEFVERVTEGPPPLTLEVLLKTMVEENLGKRKPLKVMIGWLIRQEYLRETPEGEIKLSPKGKSLNDLLNSNFGQFLAKDYHYSISDFLDEVESGHASCQDFLNEWWGNFLAAMENEAQ